MVDGFSISLSSSSTEAILPSTFDSVSVYVQTPREFGWRNRYYQLELKATSEIDGQSDSYSLAIWVHGPGVSDFEPLFSLIILAEIGIFYVRWRKSRMPHCSEDYPM